MSINSEAVKKHRNKVKSLIVESMGGSCQICGYDKCFTALDLHHIDSSEKDFSFGAIRANPKSWEKIVNELKKCILLCANCHRELHSNVTQIPEKFATFNEDFNLLNPESVVVYDDCPICSSSKKATQRYCSVRCTNEGRKNTGKINWDNIDLDELYAIHKTNVAVAKVLGVSDAYLSKRRKSYSYVKGRS